MELTISEKASQWFQQEMGVSTTRGVRFLGKVYGCSPIHEGFSLAVEVDEPSNPIVTVVKDGVLYFIEAADEWFFNGHSLEVGFDDVLKEPTYSYQKLS